MVAICNLILGGGNERRSFIDVLLLLLDGLFRQLGSLFGRNISVVGAVCREEGGSNASEGSKGAGGG